MPLRDFRLPFLLLPVLAWAGLAWANPVIGGEPVLAIGAVQGTGPASPLVGRRVVVEGRVTGSFVDGLGGFFLQDAGDGDPATADGLFVVPADPANPRLRSGQGLRVHGRVVEEAGQGGPGGGHGTLTTLQAERIEAVRAPAPRVTVLRAPPPDWEALEGMQVRIAAPLSLNGSDPRFGETSASFEGRLWTPSERAVPGSPEFTRLEADNARRRMVLDDASNRRDPDRFWYLPAGLPRAGSSARAVQGVVDQRHGGYRLQLTAPLRVRAAARPPAPRVGGTLRVAVFNLENLFNGDGRGGGFPTARGARDAAGLRAQTERLVATLRGLDADIAALMELENDGYGPQSSLAQFVDALNAGGGQWRFVDAGRGPGSDQIRVALVYRQDRVVPVGPPAVLEGGPFGERSRVPLAQAFRRGDGPVFVVVANHFKSKGCTGATGADADQGDGQACWNALRTESAARLDAWLQTDPTAQGSPLQLLVGDFNAYAMEDPLRLLRARGWQDAFDVAGVARPYSYLYAGMLGRLDHALLSPALAGRLRGAAEWHANADEPAGREPGDGAGPWRSSDHDPMLLGFDL